MTSPRAKRGQAAAETRALAAYVRLMRAASAVTTRVHAHLASDDLSTSQFAVLEALLHKGSLCSRELSEKLLTSPGNLTLVIDNLEKRELVARKADPQDRRGKQVALTRPGRRLIRRVFDRHVRVLTEDFQVLQAREQEDLARLCRKLGLGNTKTGKARS